MELHKEVNRISKERIRPVQIKRFLEAFCRDEHPLVVQIGANDGIYDDPLRSFIETYNLQALLVEPQAQAFKKLSELYQGSSSVACLKAAVTNKIGPITLYRGKNSSLDGFGSAIASTNSKSVRRGLRWHQFVGGKVGTKIFKEIVDGMTLIDILTQASLVPSNIELFACDTQGMDALIVNQLLDAGASPTVILYEHHHLDTSEAMFLDNRLLDNGYRLCATRKDTLATLS